MEPIRGIRWTCTNCPPTNDTDLCENCIRVGFRNSVHKLNHRFDKVEKAEHFNTDGDYSRISGEFSYLDPVSGILSPVFVWSSVFFGF